RDPVRELHLVDRAVWPTLARGALVGNQDDESVFEPAEFFEEAQQTSDLVVGVRQEPGVDLGHAREQLLLVVRKGIPWPRDVEGRERLGVGPRPSLGGTD